VQANQNEIFLPSLNSHAEYCAENPSSSSRRLRPRPTSGSSGFSTSSWGSSFFGIPAGPVSPTHETSHENQNSTLICCNCELEFLRSHLIALKKEVDQLGTRRNVKDDVAVLRRKGITGTPPQVERGVYLPGEESRRGSDLPFRLIRLVQGCSRDRKGRGCFGTLALCLTRRSGLESSELPLGEEIHWGWVSYNLVAAMQLAGV